MTGRAHLRSATAADAEAILALAIACDEADVGAADTDMDDIASDLAEPGCEVWVVGEPPVAYAHLAADTNAYVGVPPPACGRGIGTLIREHLEQRASEREMANLRQAAYGANDAARAHLEAAGYAKDETWWRMRGALATLAEPPPLPGDIGLADYGGSPQEERTLYELIDTAMTAVPSNRPVPFDVWVARNTRRPGFDPGLALLARDAAGDLIGAALGNRLGDGTGYVEYLAVSAERRGEGLGRSLLARLMRRFRDRGDAFADLYVASTNRVGLGLYESVGMSVAWRTDGYVKDLAA